MIHVVFVGQLFQVSLPFMKIIYKDKMINSGTKIKLKNSSINFANTLPPMAKVILHQQVTYTLETVCEHYQRSTSMQECMTNSHNA